MIFVVNEVKTDLNNNAFEASLTPAKLPEHDDPTAILKIISIQQSRDSCF